MESNKPEVPGFPEPEKGSEGGRGIVFLIVFCLILAVVSIVYVVNSGGTGGPTDPDISLEENVEPTPEPAEEPVAPKEAPKAAVQETPVTKQPAAPAAPKEDPGDLFPGAAPEPAPPKQDLETGLQKDPRLVVEPIDEPDMPLDEKKGAKYGYVPLPHGEGFVFDRKLESGKKISGVVVPGVVLVTRGVVELFGCGDGGKEHETVVRLDCDIQSLDNALTLAGFERGPLPARLDLNLKGQGSRIMILVQWQDPDGKIVTYRSEDLVVSLKRRAPMPRIGWTYVARWMKVQDPTSPTGERTFEVLAAANSRSLVTTFRDKSALLDNPLEEAVDDTLFAANYMLLPESGTPVRVIFRAPIEEERDHIMAIEDRIRKEPKNFRPDDRPDK